MTITDFFYINRSEFLLLLPNRVQANGMGSNCSKAAKCPAEWYSFPMTSNVIQRRDHSTTSVSEMAKSGRAHDIKEGIPRVGTTRQEQFCELTMGRSDSSAAKISATVNQIKEERVQVSKEETALKSNVPQYSNGKSMVTLIHRHFNYLPPVKNVITTTRRQGNDTREKNKH